jgi:hypothetical protein
MPLTGASTRWGETSVMLYVDPKGSTCRGGPVNMDRIRSMTWQKDAPGIFPQQESSTSNAATREKDESSSTRCSPILDDIEKVRTAPLPIAKGPSPRRRPRRSER